MTAFAGVFGPAAESSASAVRDMLAAMRHRAAGTPEEFTAPAASLGIARHDWEATVSGWSGPLIASDDQWMVAADATLYYLADLRRRLGTASGSGDTAVLLLQALRRWGPRFASQVEGDYAIVALERKRNRVLMARDFGGRRNLAYALPGRSLVVASSPTAVVLHPLVSGDYDTAFIAGSAAGIVSHGSRTAFRDVAVVPAGTTLSFEDGRITEVDRWTPPPFGSGWESEPSVEGAEELRALLQDATLERLDSKRLTTVWMSGGWDSTSVFASARAALIGKNGGAQSVLPISMTYPADDTGNEDAFIRAVAERWSAPVRWVDSDLIPLIGDSERRARLRDDPMAQPFEGTVRALSQVSRELDARVALDGFGGDHIFQVSSASLIADHFFYGRWIELLRTWRNWRPPLRQFARMCLLPHFSTPLLDWVGTVRGKPLAGHWDQSLPRWIVSSPGIVTDLAPQFERMPGEGAAEFESRSGIRSTFVARAMSWNHGLGLDEGVQLRAPLFDLRVVAFAASRPLSDRGAGGSGKAILRKAMRGLLPDSVLAPRDRKTGTPVGYFKRQLQAALSAEVKQFFGRGRSILQRLGVLDAEAYQRAAEEYARDGVHALGALLHLTLETERWLAARERGA